MKETLSWNSESCTGCREKMHLICIEVHFNNNNLKTLKTMILCFSGTGLWRQQSQQPGPDFSLPRHLLYSSWGTVRHSQYVHGLLWGFLPFGLAQNSSLETYDILTKCLNHLSWVFSVWRSNNFTYSLTNNKTYCPISKVHVPQHGQWQLQQLNQVNESGSEMSQKQSSTADWAGRKSDMRMV